MVRYFLFRVYIVTLILNLVACGGGGGSTSSDSDQATTLQGVFLDSAVEGLRYETDTLSGITDSDGTFEYLEGEDVRFYIGNTLIGQAYAKDVITPIDFSSQPPIEQSADTINALRLLQSLDTDNNPDNGITLPEVSEELSADLDIYSDTSLQEFVDSIQSGKQLVNTTQALQHFNDTVESLPIEDNGESYVFSHAYTDERTQIYTDLNAKLEIINGEYVLGVTLPSGYQVDYQGGNLGQLSDHESITFISAFHGVGVGIEDPTNQQTYWLSFYDENADNTKPFCRIGKTVYRLPQNNTGIGNVSSYEGSSNSLGKMDCVDVDGDYIDNAVFKFYLNDIQIAATTSLYQSNDGEISSAYLANSGLQLYEDGIRLRSSTNRDIFDIDVSVHDIFNQYSLIQDYTLKVVYTVTDSRGMSASGEEILHTASDEGAAVDDSQDSNSNVISGIFENDGNAYMDLGNVRYCYYETAQFVLNNSDISGDNDSGVSGSIQFSDPSAIYNYSGDNCPNTITEQFVSDRVRREESVIEYGDGSTSSEYHVAFTFDVTNSLYQGNCNLTVKENGELKNDPLGRALECEWRFSSYLEENLFEDTDGSSATYAIEFNGVLVGYP